MESHLGPLLAGILLLTSAGAGCIDSSGGASDGEASAGPDGDNQKPSSFFTFSCHHLECTFDGTRSDDADGQLVSYEWDFGDGTSGQGAMADHTYPQPGTYTVTLEIRDNRGAEDSSRRDVPVEEAPTGHSHGPDNDSDPERQSLPDDYHARWEGPVTPTFAENWTFPVNDSQVGLLQAGFNVSSDALPAGLAYNITVNLTDPWGRLVRNTTVDTRSPSVTWNVTGAEAGVQGTWTVRATGQGIGQDDVNATEYALAVDVHYGSAP